jgi:hypothetical protein
VVQRTAAVDRISGGLMNPPDPMFAPCPSARGSMKAGTIYAISGEDGWIYYGQVAADKAIGFFRWRDRAIAIVDEIVAAPVMSVVNLFYSSVGRAVRTGRWKKIGIAPTVRPLCLPRASVQWPVGTLVCTVREDGESSRNCRIEDPTIQQLEIMAIWDAEYHVAERLTADFGAEPAAWHVGGPVWRERRVKEEMARRSPEASWHALPEDWVWCERSPLEQPPVLP